MAALLKTENRAKFTPLTTEDFIEEGAANEESGDRWLGLDLAKALRFYQKAFTNYQQAIELNNSGQELLQDAYYNALRLLFQVYTQYMKTDGVEVLQLVNVGEVLTGDEKSVVQEISAIVTAHEQSIAVWPERAPNDLLFNTALVYTEAIEDIEEAGLVAEFAKKGEELFAKVLNNQKTEFDDFLKSTLELGTADEEPSSEQIPEQQALPDQNQQYVWTKTVQPPDILDTVISGLGLCQSVLEKNGSILGLLQESLTSLSMFADALSECANQLAREFFNDSSRAAPIEQTQLDEYLVAKQYIQALASPNLQTVYQIWDEQSLPDTPQRYMLAADSIGTIIEKLGLNGGPATAADEYWSALTQMNNYLKKAQEYLNAEYQQKKSKTMSDSELGLGALIAQISSVYIARSDIDLQRSQIQNENAQKHSQVLLNNAKAFLKNAMNLAKLSGGIREKVVEKAQRERRRFEAVSRLCLLEGKSSGQELDSILGQNTWQEDLANYRDLWYFQAFLPSL